MNNYIQLFKHLGFIKESEIFYRVRKGGVKEIIDLEHSTYCMPATKHNRGLKMRWHDSDSMLCYLYMEFSEKLWVPRPKPFEKQVLIFVENN